MLTRKQKYQRKWRKEHREEIRTYMSKWHKNNPEHKRKEATLHYLRAALKETGPVRNGWPDDGVSVEVKCGYATVRPDQFRRFAWLRRYFYVPVTIRVSKNYYECALGVSRNLSIENFLKEVCKERSDYAISLWSKLLKKVSREAQDGPTTTD